MLPQKIANGGRISGGRDAIHASPKEDFSFDHLRCQPPHFLSTFSIDLAIAQRAKQDLGIMATKAMYSSLPGVLLGDRCKNGNFEQEQMSKIIETCRPIERWKCSLLRLCI